MPGLIPRIFRVVWLLCAVVMLGVEITDAYAQQVNPPALPRSEKRLLQMGWQTPPLQQMPQYLTAAQHTPFDGLILSVESPHHSAGLGWTIFSEVPVDKAELETLGTWYGRLHWGRLTDNFLRVTVSPGVIDWYDDFDAVIGNFEAMARLARQLGFRGIMLDTEQYGDITLFSYPHRKYKNLYTYEEYRTQAFRRGRQIMRALNRAYPGITVLYTYGMTMGSQRGAAFDGSRHGYGLMIPFIEGMIRAADEHTVLVDAFEGSYQYKNETEFLAAYQLIKGYTRDFARDPRRYAQKMQAGFGLWLDHNCGSGQGLQPGGCSAGFTPASFSSSVDMALRYSDRYVWVYSQSVNWFTGEGMPPDWATVLPTIGQ